MVVEPRLQDESEFLYAAQPELLRYRTPPLTVEKVVDWYQTRAEEIEHYARQVRGGRQPRLHDAGRAASGPQDSGHVVAADGGAREPVFGLQRRDESLLLLLLFYPLPRKLLWPFWGFLKSKYT